MQMFTIALYKHVAPENVYGLTCGRYEYICYMGDAGAGVVAHAITQSWALLAGVATGTIR